GGDGSVVVVGLGRSPADPSVYPPPGISLVARFALGVSGRQLRLADRAGDPSARALRVQSRDPLIQAAADPGDATAPTTAGATVEVRNPTTGETTTIALPADHWSARPSAALPGTYRYT